MTWFVEAVVEECELERCESMEGLLEEEEGCEGFISRCRPSHLRRRPH